MRRHLPVSPGLRTAVDRLDGAGRDHPYLERVGRRVYNLTGHNGVAYCVRWSPDGKMLASSGNTTVRLWNFANGEPIATLTGHNGYVLRVAWRPDGSALASSSADKMVRIWSVELKKTVAILAGHTDWVHGIYWFPDGQHLASCGGAQDGSLRFWRAAE